MPERDPRSNPTPRRQFVEGVARNFSHLSHRGYVIPEKAGIQAALKKLDSGLRRNDGYQSRPVLDGSLWGLGRTHLHKEVPSKLHFGLRLGIRETRYA